mmetsp:Transcript_74836/g.208070  ORF Transcript_74836/g.208070 Transcript_74836/m.208070 type:complete len:341 (+) Transcript_74836:320-1342(+)
MRSRRTVSCNDAHRVARASTAPSELLAGVDAKVPAAAAAPAAAAVPTAGDLAAPPLPPTLRRLPACFLFWPGCLLLSTSSKSASSGPPSAPQSSLSRGNAAANASPATRAVNKPSNSSIRMATKPVSPTPDDRCFTAQARPVCRSLAGTKPVPTRTAPPPTKRPQGQTDVRAAPNALAARARLAEPAVQQVAQSASSTPLPPTPTESTPTRSATPSRARSGLGSGGMDDAPLPRSPSTAVEGASCAPKAGMFQSEACGTAVSPQNSSPSPVMLVKRMEGTSIINAGKPALRGGTSNIKPCNAMRSQPVSNGGGSQASSTMPTPLSAKSARALNPSRSKTA